MLRKTVLAVGVLVVGLGFMHAQAALVEGQPRVEIWTGRGNAGVYLPGEPIEIFIRPDYDCYVIVYEIDTDGYLRLLFPYGCGSDGFVEGGYAYRIGTGPLNRYYVTGPRGVEYIHVLSSFTPFRTLYWHGCDGYEAYAYDVSWRGFSDYWGCALPPRVYGDPYIAMQSIDEFICYDALEAGAAYADFTYFYVDEVVTYPRYVCYDCHGFRPHIRPYVHVCTGFSITFVGCDPCYRPCSWWWWCTPARVYCGPRYVCCSKKSCKPYPSKYKWKSRCETYSSTTEYTHYWNDRVKVKSGIDRPPAKVKPRTSPERDLYTGGQREAVKGKEVPVREPRVTEARVVPVGPRDGRDVEARTPVARKEASREPEPRALPKVRSEERGKTKRAPAKPEKVEAKKSNEKSRKKPEVKQQKSPKSRRRVESRPATKVRSTKSTRKPSRKVAPKVRNGNKGKSPQKRRSISK
jgi:hypothetical protein